MPPQGRLCQEPGLARRQEPDATEAPGAGALAAAGQAGCPQPALRGLSLAAGLWVGMIVCISLQALSFSAFVLRMDWKKAAEEVRLALLLAPGRCRSPLGGGKGQWDLPRSSGGEAVLC